jgi:tetratricopeptide (TPR) repeat protein
MTLTATKFTLCAVCVCLAFSTAACKSSGKQSATPAAKAQDPLPMGLEAFKKGHYSEAIQHYREALAKQPKSAQIYNLIGMAYRFQFNTEGKQDLRANEIAAFKKAIELDPNFVVALVNLGSTYYYAGNKKKAALLFKRVLEIMPNHPEAEQLKKMIAEAQPAGHEPETGAGKDNK